MGIDRTGPTGPLHPGPEASRSTGAARREPGRVGDPNASSPAGPAPSSGDLPASRQDRIELSDAARLLHEVDSDDREARVEQLRSQVRLGAYQVDPDSVAEHMVDRGDA